jgi:hypothetical protein
VEHKPQTRQFFVIWGDTWSLAGARRLGRNELGTGAADGRTGLAVSGAGLAFLAALGSKLADDGYAQVRALVKRLAARPGTLGNSQPGSRPPAPLVLVDRRTGLQIVLEADLPAAAYQQLTALDLSQFSAGPVHYDLARGRWRAELDEAAPRNAQPPRP